MDRRKAIEMLAGTGAAGLIVTGVCAANANLDRERQQSASIDALRDLVRVQCANGNWNHDPYMHGMANGLILALSLFQSGRPEYLNAPVVYLCDLPQEAATAPAGTSQDQNENPKIEKE